MTDEDRFGLPKMTVNQEVAASFTLFIIGVMLIISTLIPMAGFIDLGPAALGLIMVGAGYLFAVESIRELEEKDHFLARKLEKREEE